MDYQCICTYKLLKRFHEAGQSKVAGKKAITFMGGTDTNRKKNLRFFLTLPMRPKNGQVGTSQKDIFSWVSVSCELSEM